MKKIILPPTLDHNAKLIQKCTENTIKMVPGFLKIKIRAQVDIFPDFSKDYIFLLFFVDIGSSNF